MLDVIIHDELTSDDTNNVRKPSNEQIDRLEESRGSFFADFVRPLPAPRAHKKTAQALLLVHCLDDLRESCAGRVLAGAGKDEVARLRGQAGEDGGAEGSGNADGELDLRALEAPLRSEAIEDPREDIEADLLPKGVGALLREHCG